MALTSTWLGRESIERVASIRLRCYGTKPEEQADMSQRTEADRFTDGDVLILSDETGDVATATSLSLTMNLRGTPVPCQGVAWVGTVRSHRRRKVDGHGLASTVVRTLLAKARERKQMVSMLAPFRASFYEHFGFGVIERQLTWTIPTAILPKGDTSGFREATDAYFDAIVASRGRQFRQTHGDIETDARGVRYWHKTLASLGFRFIDVRDGVVTSSLTVASVREGDASVAVVHKPWWDSDAALLRMLAFLGTLKDQYSFARITLPVDLPVNWLNTERQIPHRRVDHPAATCTMLTRMQLRVLDHVGFLNTLSCPPGMKGRCTVAIRETEGHTATLALDIADGRIEARPTTQSPDLVLPDVTWASVAMGDLPITTAAALGLVDVNGPEAVQLLQPLAQGPAPFCHDYF